MWKGAFGLNPEGVFPLGGRVPGTSRFSSGAPPRRAVVQYQEVTVLEQFGFVRMFPQTVAAVLPDDLFGVMVENQHQIEIAHAEQYVVRVTPVFCFLSSGSTTKLV